MILVSYGYLYYIGQSYILYYKRLGQFSFLDNQKNKSIVERIKGNDSKKVFVLCTCVSRKPFECVRGCKGEWVESLSLLI